MFYRNGCAADRPGGTTMHRLKAILIVFIITAALLPFYLLYKYLAVRLRPKESGTRFLLWLLLVLVMIFAYTFLVVFIIKLVFPSA
ncbi:MAG: hypothetical protein U0U70_14705 [Chitinophagaceae bacterium]